MKIKIDDMVKVLAEEIIKLEEKIIYKAGINMRKLNELVNRLCDDSKDNGLIDSKIKFLKEDMVKIKPIRHKLDVFYHILKILTEKEEKKDKE